MGFIREIRGRALILSVFFMVALSQGYTKSFKPSQQSVLFHEIIRKFEDEMERDFDLTPIGSGGRVHDKIEKFDVFFSTPKDFTIDQARSLEVHACDRLLKIINNFAGKESLFYHYPFTHRDITVFIGVNDNREEVQTFECLGDKLAVITLNHGFIFYEKCHPKKASYIVVKKEPFEEAAKIVHQSDANP